MIRPALLAASLLTTSAAVAATQAHADTRLVDRIYNPREVVRIEGRAGVQATIAFGDDEHIENVAVGDSNSWQITPNKRANLLFVKPLGATARTNMTVVTDRRRYFFDLAASPAGQPVYLLSFKYPDEENEPQNARGAAPAAGLTAEEAGAVNGAPGTRPVDPAELNFAWATRGSGKLLPARVYDDGQAIYLSWTPGNPIPAILTRNEKGAEGPVNFAVRDDVIVIDGVPGLVVLRLGKETATLENRGEPPKPAAVSVPALAAAETAAPAPKDQ